MHDTRHSGKKIAIVGTGVSGLVAARLLHQDHEIVVYEAAHYAGGHANSIDVELNSKRFVIDTGFMVFNDRTYPNFCRLLDILGTQARNSDMSFSVRCDQTGLEYQGSSIGGLFAQKKNLMRPSFLRMLMDIVRFNRESRELVAAGNAEMTLGRFLEQGKYAPGFRRQYLIPMIAAIWSAPPSEILELPAVFIIRFFDNHGLLQVRDRPVWKTIPGGARQYVRSLVAPFQECIRLNSPVDSITRHDDCVEVQSLGRTESFDKIVLATHADQSLGLLTDADDNEREFLGAFPYQENEAVLHTDVTTLPRRRGAWASWNYRVNESGDDRASVTYDLSRLQGIDSPEPILITLNPVTPIDPTKVLRRFTYHHPVFSLHSIATQSLFGRLQGHRRTYFCGAYRFNGFHEDGVNSALEVGAHFGKGLEDCKAACTKATSRINEFAQ